MNRYLSVLAVMELAILCGATTVLAAPSQPASARAAAMGNAMLAADGEPASVFSNPAGIAPLQNLAISSFFNKPYLGLPGISLWSSELAAAVPLPYGNLGIGYSLFQADALLREQTVVLAYGANPWHDLEAGLAVKYLWHGYLIGEDPLAAADPVFENGTCKGVVSLDLGLRQPVWDFLTAGLVVRNCNQPDWGLASEDRIPLELQGGFLFNWPEWKLTAAADVQWKNTLPNQTQEPLVPSLGLQSDWLGEVFALRLGVNPVEATAGFGYRWNAWTLDYAMALKFNLLADNFGTHKIGLTYGLLSAPQRPGGGER